MPPLRERPDDVEELVNHFIAKIAGEEGKKVVGITAEALDLLTQYPWPGNVRQLENTIFRAVVLCDSSALEPEDFPQILGNMPTPKLNPFTDSGIEVTTDTAAIQTPVPTPEIAGEPIRDNVILAQPHASSRNPFDITATDPEGHLRKLEEVESEMIRMAIERYSGHMTEVARRLGIGRSTLYRKVRDLGLEARTGTE